MRKTSIGLNENVAGALCYALGWLSGIFFILVELENNFVRFHATQSMIVFSGLAIISVAVSWLPYIGVMLVLIVAAVSALLWIFLMVKAYQGKMYKLPWAGDWAEKWLAQQNQ